MLPKESCRTCQSFVESVSRDGTSRRGDCRRFPPLQSGRRQVDEAYWCREWSPIEGGRLERRPARFTPLQQAGPVPDGEHAPHQGKELGHTSGEAKVQAGTTFPGQREHLLQRTAELQVRIQAYAVKLNQQRCIQQQALDERSRLEERISELRKELNEIDETAMITD